jgi:hypothetical protein
MPLDETAAAPFARGRWLLSHNGVADRSMLGPHLTAASTQDEVRNRATEGNEASDQSGRFDRHRAGWASPEA